MKLPFQAFQALFGKSLTEKRDIQDSTHVQKLFQCVWSSDTGNTFNIAYLFMMIWSQSRPNLSKQHLDQKSKDFGAIYRLNTFTCLLPCH